MHDEQPEPTPISIVTWLGFWLHAGLLSAKHLAAMVVELLLELSKAHRLPAWHPVRLRMYSAFWCPIGLIAKGTIMCLV